ncbi:unnamed protein product [Adineta ricciae]|uniref:Sulfotransferase n=1 Tax=Adineta ricciae TaxID=249248 RepID=A0A815VY41_ADIRI|nr:unnamed protein product [Adineta ricciae]CAF1541483.1 unnamed protein product [Adineta ricciae]
METTSNEVTTNKPILLEDVNLHEDDLTEQAKNRFGYHSTILHAFELHRRLVLEATEITPVGRHLLLSLLDKLHTDSKQVLNYCAANSDQFPRDFSNSGPLILCGLPRTGSTLLYNLLACDTDCRAPLFTDMCVQPVPPIPRSNSVEHERRGVIAGQAAKLDEQLVGRTSFLKESHPEFPIEEDIHIMYQTGIVLLLTGVPSPRQSEFDAWIWDQTNKDFAYDYHEMFLRMLNSVDAPPSHWLLKSVSHCLYLDTLFSHYPNASFIMTHRQLDKVLPSFCSMLWALSHVYFDEDNAKYRDIVNARTLQYIDQMIKRIVEFRTRRRDLDQQILDINYDEITRQPIATVRRIYDHFGFRWSNEFEIAMQNWLRDNPQGKQGRHTYSLTDIHRTHDDIKAQYNDYIKLFLSSSPTTSSCSKNNNNE